jgi:hypothetical protein
MNIIKFLYREHIPFGERPTDFNYQAHHLLEHFDQNPNSIPDDKFLYLEDCDFLVPIEDSLRDIKELHDKYNIDYNKIIFVTSYHILDLENRPSLIDKINYYELEFLLTYSAFDENGSSSACHMFDSIESFPNDTKLCIKTVFENSKSFVRQKHYLTYNGYMKEHRVKLLGFLVEKDLLDKGLSSFFYYDEEQLPQKYIDEYTYDEIEDKTVISKIQKIIPYSFDLIGKGSYLEEFNVDSNGINITSQFSTYFNIVTENQWESGKPSTPQTIFLTEKICKPLFLFQPFIVIGQRGALKQLKRLGFKTFEGPYPMHIDESYDEVIDFDERFIMIEKEIKRLCDMSLEEIHKWYWEMEDILLHNHNNFIKIQEQGPKKFIDFMENVIE